MARGLFIAGTGTEVGKTYVAALIARQLAADGHRVGVYKPVASGCRLCGPEIVSDDALTLWQAIEQRGELNRVCPQRFAAPLAPPQAARAEGREVNQDRLLVGLHYWQRSSDIVIVEGAGGLMSPVSDAWYCGDLAAACRYPLVVVTPNVLGTINGTLQTLITARTFHPPLHVAGLVVNDVRNGCDDPSTTDNRAEVARRGRVPTVTAVAWKGQSFDRDVDWYALASSPPGDGSSP
jgi:dethiobiotin synthetase